MSSVGQVTRKALTKASKEVGPIIVPFQLYEACFWMWLGQIWPDDWERGALERRYPGVCRMGTSVSDRQVAESSKHIAKTPVDRSLLSTPGVLARHSGGHRIRMGK